MRMFSFAVGAGDIATDAGKFAADAVFIAADAGKLIYQLKQIES